MKASGTWPARGHKAPGNICRRYSPFTTPTLLTLTAAVLLVGVTHAQTLPRPIHAWDFSRAAAEGNRVNATAGGLQAHMESPLRVSDSPAYIDLDGSDCLTAAEKGEALKLPVREITVETWVALRDFTRWGGYVGYIQDNGSYEKGWVLGNYENHFSFGISTAEPDDGDGFLTYLAADSEIPIGQWCHVVGTYDGARLCVYVDGKLENSTDKHSGDISYADSWLAIGGYKDDNESFPLDGGMHLARIYDVALTEAQVKARFEESRTPLVRAGKLTRAPVVFAPRLVDGPLASFTGQSSATIRWSTRTAMPSVVEFGRDGDALRRIGDAAARTEHSVTVGDLSRNTVYAFCVIVSTPDGEAATEPFTLDTQFDFTPAPMVNERSPYPDDDITNACGKAASAILNSTGITDGYCLDIGCGDGRLAWELARRSSLRVVGFSTDEDAIRRGRQVLIAAGDYGDRVTLRHVESLTDLPVPDMSANLIVSQEAIAGGPRGMSEDEIARKLRPITGKACFPVGQRLTTIARPDPLQGAGAWTHAYGDAGQTAGSHDELVRGQTGETLEVQWFGLPGPNAMVDRLARKQGPLSTAGRLFTLGNDRVIAQDAYNGTILWSLEMPGLNRNNIPRNTGNACAADDYLFVAMRDRCWRLDAATGERSFSYSLGGEPEGEHSWGYVATDGDRLFGSAVRRGNFETEFRGPKYWFDNMTGTDILNVCSENLFADRVQDGERLWTYAGLIINSTISMGDGRLYFLESRGQSALETESRKLGADLWDDVYLVALDAATGKKLWERPFDAGGTPIVIYAVSWQDQVAVFSSLQGRYFVRTHNARDGEPLWESEHAWRSNNHGHHIQHPVIARARVTLPADGGEGSIVTGDSDAQAEERSLLFLEPNVYDWRTGRAIAVTFPSRSKCGTITGAATALHYRDYNDEVWDLTTNTQSEFSRLRTGCWIGMISGSGLLMSPESAGGCSCSWPIYTSLTYRMKDDY